METELGNLKALENKKVKVTYTPGNGGQTLETEATLLAVSDKKAILVRERGRSVGTFIQWSEIEKVDPITTVKPKAIQQKLLRTITLTDARSHLAERHSMSMPEVNKMTDQEAYAIHESIEHKLLGHTH